MPRHLISDAHAWINEIPTVPIYYLAKPQPRERTWEDQWGKKTLLSLTLVSYCGSASVMILVYFSYSGDVTRCVLIQYNLFKLNNTRPQIRPRFVGCICNQKFIKLSRSVSSKSEVFFAWIASGRCGQIGDYVKTSPSIKATFSWLHL